MNVFLFPSLVSLTINPDPYAFKGAGTTNSISKVDLIDGLS